MYLDSGPDCRPPAGAGQCCEHCPGDCADACFNDAIERLPRRGVRLLANNCAGCGACLPLCELHRLTLAHGCVRLVLERAA